MYPLLTFLRYFLKVLVFEFIVEGDAPAYAKFLHNTTQNTICKVLVGQKALMLQLNIQTLSQNNQSVITHLKQ